MLVVVDTSGPEEVSCVVGRPVLGAKGKQVGEGACDGRDAEQADGSFGSRNRIVVGLLGGLCRILILTGRGSYLLVVVGEEGVGWGGPSERAVSVDEVDGVGDPVETLLKVSYQVRVEDNPSDPVGQGAVFFVRNGAARKKVVVNRLVV